jgi:FkbM family methyltransferase
MERLGRALRRPAHALFAAIVRRLFGTRVAATIWRIPGSSGLYRWLMSRLRPSSVVVDGHTLELDHMDSLLLSVNGTYEEQERRLFSACIRPGDCVLDVGAHIGLYTVQAARATGPEGTVIAFEPSTENHELLVRNLNRNGYQRVEVVRAAVADFEGSAALGISGDNTGDHSLVSDGARRPGAETVPVIRLDSWRPGLRPDVVKMDIQGAEPLAVAGAATILAACESLVLFTEFSPSHLLNQEARTGFFTDLCALGFSLYDVTGGICLELGPADLEGMAASDTSDHWNLVAVKGTGVQRVKAALASRH